MKVACVTVERDCVKVSRVSWKWGGARIYGAERLPFPDARAGGKLSDQPTGLGHFIAGSLSKTDPAVGNVALLLGKDIGFFNEYVLKFSDKEQFETLRRIETEHVIGTDPSKYIIEDIDYGVRTNGNHMRIRAITGVERAFLGKVEASLKQDGYRLCFAGSAVVSYARMIAPLVISVRKRRPKPKQFMTGVDLEERRFLMAMYAPDGLIHMEETRAADVVSVCARRLTARRGTPHTVILSGNRFLMRQLTDRLKDDGAPDCTSVADYRKRYGGRVSLAGALAGDEGLLPEVFASAGPDIRRSKTLNYLRVAGMREICGLY
ncbi:MAG: hypothetical protein LBO81_02555 [Clostridiales Family XIII bacterium]|jgi:hypothetical protein|nr:hypothetical protein [Clostridiales Family XIII bacterium]